MERRSVAVDSMTITVKTRKQQQAFLPSFTIDKALSCTTDILAVKIYLKGCCGEDGLLSSLSKNPRTNR